MNYKAHNKNFDMARKIAFMMIFVLALSILICGCTPKLSDSQEKACNKTDDTMEEVAEILDADFTKKIKKIDGKIVYIAKLDCEDPSIGIAETLQEEIFWMVDYRLEKEDIVFVMYYGDFDDNDMYRMFDESKIDGDKLE